MKRARRNVRGISEGELLYFLFDCDMMDGITANFKSSCDERECYENHKDLIIHEFISRNPCERPRMWWKDRGQSRPIDPINDFYNRFAEAEALYDMGEIQPDELKHLDHLRQFYGRCRAMEKDRI